MDDMFHVKRKNGEYISKKELRDSRKKIHVAISEEWIRKQESFEDRQSRLRGIDPFKLSDTLSMIDKKFCKGVEEFVGKYKNFVDIKKSHDKEMAIFDDRLRVSNIGRDIVRNFILERSNFLIKSNALYIPDCEKENEVNMWFEENCNDLCLGISVHKDRHSKFHIRGSGSYSGVDYICNFIGSTLNTYEFVNCKNNNYRPFLNRYMDEKQSLVHNQFYEFVETSFMLIGLEYLSSNFVRHKHPSVVDMVICYKKDKDLSVPVLELGMGRDMNV